MVTIAQRLDQLEGETDINNEESSIAPSYIDTEINSEIGSNSSQSQNGDDDEDESLHDQKETLDLLCLGDSIIRWINVDEIKPESNNKNVCLPGAKIVDVRDSLMELNDTYNISNLYLHVP